MIIITVFNNDFLKGQPHSLLTDYQNRYVHLLYEIKESAERQNATGKLSTQSQAKAIKVIITLPTKSVKIILQAVKKKIYLWHLNYLLGELKYLNHSATHPKTESK